MRRRFAAYEIGDFHIDFAELRTAREKVYPCVAVDRTSKAAFARVYRRATSLVAAAFLRVLARAVPRRWRTPVETLEALWTSNAELFRRSPDHLTLGPST